LKGNPSKQNQTHMINFLRCNLVIKRKIGEKREKLSHLFAADVVVSIDRAHLLGHYNKTNQLLSPELAPFSSPTPVS